MDEDHTGPAGKPAWARANTRLLLGCSLAGLLALGALGAKAQGGILAAAAQINPAQADAGKTAYGGACASCHGGGLNDGEFGPALKGPAFLAHWNDQTPQALFTYIQTRMPPSAAGSLSAQTYASIMAYILQANGAVLKGTGAAPAPASAPAPAAAAPAPVVAQRSTLGRDAVYAAAIARRDAKLAALTPVTDAMLKSPPPGEWLMARRTYDALGHSPLSQINARNVAQLRPAWSWTLPPSQNELTPVVHDGVMFIESAATVQAIDAVTGDLLWQYVRPTPVEEWAAGRTTRVKSFALYKHNMIVPTVDGHVLALDIRSGKVVWDQEVITDDQADRKGQADGVPLHMDGGPIVANGKVVIGVSLGITNAKGGCFIVGLDAETGKEAWRFHTIDQSPVGKDSWNGAPPAERFGGGVWTAGSYDPDLNLVYFGIGNTYDAATLLQPHAMKGASNDGLYTDATVALNADTGKLVWHYQHMNRDVWDLDWVFEQTVVTLPVAGKPRKLVVTGGKIAIFDAVDAATGEYVFSKDLGLQNIVTAIDPKTGKKTTNPALEPEPGKAKFLCPGSSGARSWPATALNPKTKILYVPLIELCADYTWVPRSAEETAAGGIDMRFASRPMANHDGNFGRIEAINLETKQVVWTRRQRAPVASAMLSTAGGVVFNGSIDRRFTAFDEATGKVLWETKLNASPSSSPITYAVNGKQYVAVIAGGGGAFDSTGRGMAPEIASPAGGLAVSVFALP